MASQSLIETIQTRADTAFHGERVTDAGPDVYTETELYEDETGVTYTCFHDYVGTKAIDGEQAGILVADTDAPEWMDHAHAHLPHLMGLYVKESYRSNGIGTALVEAFMADQDADTCVVDAEPHAIPFYTQLECDVVWLGEQPTPPAAPSLSATTS